MADTDMDTSGILTPDPPETRSTRTTMPLLKPNKPSKFTGTRDHATVENWIASVNSYFALTNARPRTSFTISTRSLLVKQPSGFAITSKKTKLTPLPGKRYAKLFAATSYHPIRIDVFKTSGLPFAKTRQSNSTSHSSANL